MPDPTPRDPAPVLARAAALADDNLAQLAQSLGYSDNSVRRAMARYAPVQETLATVKREVGIAAWQTLQFKALAAADEILDSPKERGFAKDVQGLAITAGIATEKAQLLQGLPTQITQVTTDLRVTLPHQLERLARVLQGRQGGIGPGVGTHHREQAAIDVTPTPIIGSGDPTRGR